MEGVWDGHAKIDNNLIGMKLNITRKLVDEEEKKIILSGQLSLLTKSEFILFGDVKFTSKMVGNESGILDIVFLFPEYENIRCFYNVFTLGPIFAYSHPHFESRNEEIEGEKGIYDQCTFSLYSFSSTALDNKHSIQTNHVVSHSNNAFTLTIVSKTTTSPIMFTFLQRIKESEKTWVQKYGPYIGIAALILVRIAMTWFSTLKQYKKS